MPETKARPYYIGIMSGTSLDGIDVAICRFEGKHTELVALHSEEWQPAMRARLMEFATSELVEMDALIRTHFELAKMYASAVEAALHETGIPASQIRAIGLHGQTVRHLPSPPIWATFQLGSGAALAAITAIDVVSDFRAGDMALGGQGAPLVPMFDYHFLRSETSDRLIVNIGGISNVTWLPANASAEDVIAFDTGPGNMLLDAIARRYFDKPFDESGEIARSGTIDQNLLDEFLSHPYFAMRPPKSTGRELFSENFLRSLHDTIVLGKLSPNDALATLTELTARSIMKCFEFLQPRANVTEIIVSGGGAFNQFLLDRVNIAAETSSVSTSFRITTSDTYGIPAKAKEAIAFAFFAKAFIEEIPIHLPSTTGATRQKILGSLSCGN